MSKNQIIKNYKEALKAMKEEMLEEIINAEDMSKVEKLEAISENELLPIAGYIQNPFGKYYQQFKEKIWSSTEFDEKYGRFERNGRKYDPCIDDIFHTDRWQRHETIDFSQIARDYDDDDYWDDEDGKDGITIMTNRNTKDVLKIPKDELIDCLYEWVIENKKIGFILDW